MRVIENCYDSHVHWLGTGLFASRLNLSELKKPEDVSKLVVEQHHYKGEWLVGYGWDQNLWPGQQYPNRYHLDQVFGETPVMFTRVDGHASWVNTEALKRAGLLIENGSLHGSIPEIKGGKVVAGLDGLPSGVLIDLAMGMVKKLLPESSAPRVRAGLIKAAQIFNQAGFTHIRDMSCDEVQWAEACHLDENGLLTLAVEQFFDAEDPNDFDTAMALAKAARSNATPNLRPQGLKVYYDGALGSEGALISQPYGSGSGKGLELLEADQLQAFMRLAWENGFDLAIHVNGDESADRVSLSAVKVWDEGLDGRLHLEHSEVVRRETIERLRGRDVICHMQPCHWLSDKKWIDEKLGALKQFVFPWRALQEASIRFFFGSDSPIEPPSLANNLLALDDSAMSGVPSLLDDGLNYHSHPDKTWTPNTYTHYEDGRVTGVVFRGQHLV